MVDVSSQIPVIRTMTTNDLDRIIEIDTKVLGRSRADYWEMKLELVDKRSPMASLVAEIEGEVIAFVIGDASGWEYGVPEHIGWVDTIGVDPAFQRKGLATMLVTEMISTLQ